MLGRHRKDVRTAEVGDGEVPLATLGGRIVARLADFLILVVPIYVVLGFVLPDDTGTVILIALLGMVVYDTLSAARNGTTPGKRMARIKIVRVDTGAPPGFLRAFARGLLALPLSVMPALTALFDERTHRGGHDRVAGTIVIADLGAIIGE
ncbi:RDD family protein [Kibdelosporangium philippinense]|uniref:RDD family protein n=1 Tax=Kibdelosporangium philippinense TaxID=211113 RepID=A0ABS8ZZB0_9PSEU|nr:RDD family protein [Kibdelosporangium philippinense]MCE7011637.1 RDD family protein [Kibdelosporangium philippinense]